MTTPVFEPASLSEFLLKAFPREYVSASSLKMAVKCPEQWRRRYVLGHKAPPNANMLWGGADHKAVAVSYQQKIESEKDLPVDEVKELFAAEVEKKVDEAGGAGEVEWSGRDYEDKTPLASVSFVKDRGTKLVGMYQEQVASVTFPLTVEQEFLVPLNGLPPVKGFIDLTAQRMEVLSGTDDERPGPRFVVERKTKGVNQPPAPEDRFQARLYELASGLPVEFQVSVKSAQPRVVVHEPQPLSSTENTLRSLKRTVLELASYYTLYGEDQPWPDHGRLHPWGCGTPQRPMCGFLSTCPFWHPEFWPK